MTLNSKGTALVTGASSGVGAIHAGRLAHRGYGLILVPGNARRLGDETGRAIEMIAADLARAEQVLRTDAGITAPVNGAGVGATGPLLSSVNDRIEEMITLNVMRRRICGRSGSRRMPPAHRSRHWKPAH